MPDVAAIPRVRLRQGEDPRLQPHVLTISVVDGEKEYEVEHPEACPRVCAWWRDGEPADVISTSKTPRELAAEGHAPEWSYDCYVAHELDNNGLDSLDVGSFVGDRHFDPDHVPASRFEPEWPRLRPGRYLIEGWYTPFYWAGSEPCDADGGLSILEVLDG